MVSFPLFLLAVIWLLYKLFSEKPCPPGHRFDSDKKTEDMLSGISFDEIEHRQKKGYYWTPKEEIERRNEEKKSFKYGQQNIVDVERYEKDKKTFGEEYTEILRMGGAYLIIKETSPNDKIVENTISNQVTEEGSTSTDNLAPKEISEEPQTKYDNPIPSSPLSSIHNDSTEKVNTLQIDSSDSLVRETELSKMCIQLLEEYDFESVSTTSIDDDSASYHYVHVSAIKDNRKYAFDLQPEMQVSIVSIHETLYECLRALCGIDIMYPECTFFNKLEDFGFHNLNLNIHIRSLAMTSYHPCLCITGTIFRDKHKYKIQTFIELLDDEVPNVSLNKEDLHLQQNRNKNYELENPITQQDFDSINGHEFENFCADILKKNGYVDVTVTRGSGDQGIDIIAYKDDVKYGIQCKCYASDVGNKAVQEVFSGKTFYNCHVGVVLTNSYFTHSAVELAQSNGVILWNRDKLLQMIESAKRMEGIIT